MKDYVLWCVCGWMLSCMALASGQQFVFLGQDEEAKLFHLRLPTGERFDAVVGQGDLAVGYAEQALLTGNLSSREDVYYLDQIFPAVTAADLNMRERNRLLRRDTVTRGRKAFRGVGEFLPPFALFNEYAEVVTPESLRGKVVIMNFIFTRCRMAQMCPAATQRMAQLQDLAAEEGVSDVQFVSISFDPNFDSPGVFQSYGKGYGIDFSNFDFLTGDLQAIKDLQKQFGIITKDEEGTINHSMATVLIDPMGKIQYWRPGSRWNVEDFLQRTKKSLEASGLAEGNGTR